MANVEHKNLTDPELHEPKGIATASSGQVYIANGSGSGTWTSQDPAYAQGYVEGNVTATTFLNTTEKKALSTGAGFVTDITNDFTVDVNGLFTYTGTKNRIFFASASIFCTQGSAANKLYSFWFAKNGTAVDATIAKADFDNALGGENTITGIIQLTTNDTIQLFVRADTDTTSLVFSAGSVKIFELGW